MKLYGDAQHTDPESCPYCGRMLKGLMAVDPSKPGLFGLLRGEGDDWSLNAVARLAALLVVFATAMLLFWMLGLTLNA